MIIEAHGVWALIWGHLVLYVYNEAEYDIKARKRQHKNAK
jgi:hypothetical protein